jgi:hypothetical protein
MTRRFKSDTTLIGGDEEGGWTRAASRPDWMAPGRTPLSDTSKVVDEAGTGKPCCTSVTVLAVLSLDILSSRVSGEVGDVGRYSRMKRQITSPAQGRSRLGLLPEPDVGSTPKYGVVLMGPWHRDHPVPAFGGGGLIFFQVMSLS